MNNSFAQLFRKYRLRAEFATLSELAEALSQKGLHYEDSIFSHWQKGTRIPHERNIVLKLLKLFIERNAIISLDQANELLESTGQGFLTKTEIDSLPKFEIKKVIFQVPNEVSDFTGREDFLDTITHNARKGKVIHIYGTAGVGKTTLAIKAAHVLRSEFQDGVLWYRMDTCSMKDMLLSIGHLLKEPPPPSQNIEVLSAWSRAILSQKKILLILDNVEKDHQIHLLLPNTSSSIIILSRYKDLYIPANQVTIQLQSFTDSEVLALFENICTEKYIQKYQKQLLEIGNVVGNLPLAIQMLAKQLKESESKPEDLLRKLEREEGLLQNISYENKTLYATMQVSYNHLSKSAQTILLSLGVFEGRDFSLDAIAHINGLSVEKTETILQELINTSFIESSVKNKLRVHPMIKKFISEKINNPYIFPLLKITGILFIFFTFFWMTIQIVSKINNMDHVIFSDSYFVVALYAGLWGVYIAQKWGGMKSLMGKSILFFSFGLFAETFGQIIYGIYYVFLHIETPYPSIGDFGFFSSIPFYTYSVYYLAKASGVKIQMQDIKEKSLYTIVTIGGLTLGYILLLQQYTFNWNNPLKIFFDFGYPLGDTIFTYFALISYIKLRIAKNKVMKNKMLLFLIALCFQWFADYTFVYQANNNTWHPGQLNDYIYFSAYILMTIAILQLNSYRFKLLKK